MKKNQHGFIKLLATIIILSASSGCKAQQPSSTSYDINHPNTVIELPHEVNEISGITYENGYVYAIDDEHGDLFKIELKKNPKVQSWNFGAGKDYEDVVLANGRFYVLNSNGHIIQFPEKFPIKNTKKAGLDISGRNEFESLYYDPSTRKVIMLCKDCSSDGKNENTTWSFDPSSGSFDKKPSYSINGKEIENVSGKSKGSFKPSAATINPLTNELYVLSSINKELVILKNGKVQNVLKLKSKLFKQPEGICFTPSGDLLISNESAKKGPATILVFKRSK